MKRYNITPITRSFSWGEMPVIELGEYGRGRDQQIVAYHADFDDRFLGLAASKSGKAKVVASDNSDGWLAVVRANGCYTRGSYGSVYCLPAAKDTLRVVARGHGAYGDAGRIGGWNEFLVIIPDDTFLKVRPVGGDGKVDRFWLFFGAKEAVRVEKSEMDMFCDRRGWLAPPEQCDKLIDLVSLPLMEAKP